MPQEHHRAENPLPPKSKSAIDEINLMLQTSPRSWPTEPPQSNSKSRLHPNHGVYISPSKPTIVYGTICCQDREPWLAKDDHHTLLLDIWKDKSHWVVGHYVLMPDHLHVLAAPQPSAVEFDAWAIYCKSQFTKRRKDKLCVWQTDHWDTRIRNFEHYEEKVLYIMNNPVRAGLVAKAEDWQYSGTVHDLRWE